MTTTDALMTLIALAAGLAAGWALARARSAAETTIASRERDAAVAERDELRAERESLLASLRDAEVRLAEVTTRLAAQEQSETQLKDTFARMSMEALQRSSTQFLELADARFKQAGAPLTDTLTKVETQLREIEKERAGAQQSLRQQIETVRTTSDALRESTAALVSALRKPQARGRWGELQLRRCIEHAGMTDRCDFYEQATVSTDDGLLRPDVLVRLVGGKSIVVDSKVTLSAYLEAYEAQDDITREERLAAHAKHLRQHVNDLAAKAYWAQFSPSPEFVVLFVPGDPFLAAALDRDPSLYDDAFTKRVHIATPTTLISTLRAVAYAWQQEALAKNAQQVFELGRELYARLSTMGGHVDKLGRTLSRAVTDYNATVGSLESKVMVTARRLQELEVVDDELRELGGLDDTVRPLTKSELVESAESSRAVVTLPVVDELEPDRTADYGIDAGAAGRSAPGATPLERRTGS